VRMTAYILSNLSGNGCGATMIPTAGIRCDGW
jgi:hypothetical protein